MIRPGMVLLLAVLAVALPGARDAAAEGPCVAICLFADGIGAVDAPVNAGALRHESRALLSAAFRRRGFSLAADERQVELMARWRVRSAEDIPAGFMRELAEVTACKRLLVARLRILDKTLLLSCRVVDTTSGRLVWVDIVERPLPNWREVGVAAWWQNLAGAAEELAARWPSPEPAPGPRGLILLPTQSVAAGAGETSLLTECLMRRLLIQGDWWLPDPALVLSRLRERGEHHTRISGDLRRSLAEVLGGAKLLRASLVSYGPGRGRRLDLYTRESPSQGLSNPFYGTLLLLDSADGSVEQSARAYLPQLSPRGVFGLPSRASWIDRIDELAATLLLKLPPLDEE